jgi:hypothetical protein
MPSGVEQYRHLTRECLKVANIVPAGPPRDTLIEMDRKWAELANQQNGIADLDEDE